MKPIQAISPNNDLSTSPCFCIVTFLGHSQESHTLFHSSLLWSSNTPENFCKTTAITRHMNPPQKRGCSTTHEPWFSHVAICNHLDGKSAALYASEQYNDLSWQRVILANWPWQKKTGRSITKIMYIQLSRARYAVWIPSKTMLA